MKAIQSGLAVPGCIHGRFSQYRVLKSWIHAGGKEHCNLEWGGPILQYEDSEQNG
jgi:hypothetical protein